MRTGLFIIGGLNLSWCIVDAAMGHWWVLAFNAVVGIADISLAVLKGFAALENSRK